MNQLATAILVIVGAILPVVNPPGDAPIFLHLTHGCDDATRARLARGVASYSFALLRQIAWNGAKALLNEIGIAT